MVANVVALETRRMDEGSNVRLSLKCHYVCPWLSRASDAPARRCAGRMPRCTRPGAVVSRSQAAAKSPKVSRSAWCGLVPSQRAVVTRALSRFSPILRARCPAAAQLTGDGHHAYFKAVGQTFKDTWIDYAMLQKFHGRAGRGTPRVPSGLPWHQRSLT